MNKFLKNKDIFFVLILVINIILTVLLQNLFKTVHFAPKNLFFFDLIGKQLYLPFSTLFIFNIGSLILLWFISKKIFNNNFAFIPVVVWSISPWSYYLVASNSFYIYPTFLILVIVYCALLFKSGLKNIASILITIAVILGIYSSFFLLILFPIFFIAPLIYKNVIFEDIKPMIKVIFVLCMPLFILILKNSSNFKNIANNNTGVFSDPSVINTSNRYEGASKDERLSLLSRISENKYIFYTEYLALKYAVQISPVTIFTSQYKLLNFSFSPPVLFGFAIPFSFGLYKLIQKKNIWKTLLFSTVLVLPSVFANELVRLNRLFLFFPVVIFIITFGLTELYSARRNKNAKLFLTITFILVIVQSIIILGDIPNKEIGRFNRYSENKLEITGP